MQFLIQGEAEIQTVCDLLKAQPDQAQFRGERLAPDRFFIAIQQQVRDLAVGGKTLAGRGDDNKTPLRIAADDLASATEVPPNLATTMRSLMFSCLSVLFLLTHFLS